ncbi:protein Wnt-1-like [Cloeon dipterum]|uniref:Protein Wnt n=2 Tax=Cloeon dipterum TaxID=197152 RepID=A0A8S1BVW0_9INSE|nr:Hypothetical predicted protein [Cloeon dipterum]
MALPTGQCDLHLRLRALALAFLVLTLPYHSSVEASWWMLGLPNSIPGANEVTPMNYKEVCKTMHFLNERQKELCVINESILMSVGMGAKLGIDECQHQFRMSRWNCTTNRDTSMIFGNVLAISSREKAFIYAVSAAGVAYAITKSCSRGDMNECNCDYRMRERRQPKGNWQWGGCSDDFQYGEKFSRDFVDSKENAEDVEGLVNLHNNEAGRRTVRSRMLRVCKCHGMSGSCSLKVCWRKLPPFRTVGDALLARFEGASHVKLIERKRKRVKKLRPVHKDMKPPNRTELVFLEESPDYCERNDTLGVMGTRGRQCNRTSMGMDGCRLLCCGRGYQTKVREVEEKCQCRFVWCCSVECEKCRYKREEHICN